MLIMLTSLSKRIHFIELVKRCFVVSFSPTRLSNIVHWHIHNTYSFLAAFGRAFEVASCAVAASAHLCDTYLVAMVSVVNALFVAVSVHQVLYENGALVLQMMVRHCRNVVRRRLSGIANGKKLHRINKIKLQTRQL